MSCNNFKELKNHLGHDIQCVGYGKAEITKNGKLKRNLANVAIECFTCNEVILDFDKE